ncbi:NUDIX hydrolase [Tenacibaculum sp. 190524A05c]|uniref:ADP-ribose pyrophosphatase YjhB (NUDIX family) n=1 Tax=Tenacibaculum platacis TaxID=3137852 RepID=A0ABP1EXW7_9FLAO
MYKVFVNDRPIIFTSSPIKNGEYPVMDCKDIILNDVIKQVKKGKLKGVYVFTSNLKEFWARFCVDYRLKKAGGGLVVNSQKEVLFIFRARKWDLPKGRIENNENIQETALREVQEESGISELTIDKFLMNTYHLYPSQGRDRLKMTYWYVMNTTSNTIPKPLLDEGIKRASFFDEATIQTNILKRTYINIRMVYKTYRDSIL